MAPASCDLRARNQAGTGFRTAMNSHLEGPGMSSECTGPTSRPDCGRSIPARDLP